MSGGVSEKSGEVCGGLIGRSREFVLLNAREEDAWIDGASEIDTHQQDI